MKIQGHYPFKGQLKIETIDRTTGEVVEVYDEQNTITYEGFAEMLNRLTKNDGTITDSWVKNIVLGTDIGTGDIFEPEPENPSLEASDQDPIYDIPVGDIVLNYNGPSEFELSTVLQGTYIMDTFFPTEVDMRFTSATVRYWSGNTLSYKRFPVRSLSRLVDIRIVWAFTFTEIFSEE